MSPKLFPELKNRHGLVVIMFPNDHLPAHVHVYQSDNIARINFEPEELAVMDSSGFRDRELNDVRNLLKPYRAKLIELWNAMHPDIPYNPSKEEK